MPCHSKAQRATYFEPILMVLLLSDILIDSFAGVIYQYFGVTERFLLQDLHGGNGQASEAGGCPDLDFLKPT
jgi:hypothetical protein